MKNISALIALTAVLLSAAPVRAIELSLEENRAERGSVGYVDMQRLFATSPDAQRAKEGFQELVRQAEERVNLRKAELLKLRLELDAARSERDALALSTAAAPSPEPPAASTASAVAPTAAPAAAPAAQKPATMTLPGMTAPDTATAAPPSASSAAAPGLDALLSAGTTAAVTVSTPAASAAGLFPAPAPSAVPKASPAPAGPTLAQSLLELDGKIIHLQSEVARAESELTQEHDEADHGLLDVESRRTDQVLARLYRAITQVARRDGVSVVVDKTTILYGHPAVDLTDKVLKYLQEAQP